MATPVWIGLGSNLGDRRANLEFALESLATFPGVVVDAVSSYHETAPVGGPSGQGTFLNAAARLETNLPPSALLSILQRVENHGGRDRTVRWGERTLDLDLLIFGTKFLDTNDLKLPHPRLAFRRFVLAPLAEIAPTVVDPMTKRTIADLLANLDRRPRLVAIEGPEGPMKDAVFRRLVEELPGFGISQADLDLPDQVEGEDLQAVLTEQLDRKAGALKTTHWASEPLRVPWVVADYFLDFDLIRASTRRLWKDTPRSEAESRARFAAHRQWKRQVAERTEVALRPTFVVILPEDRGMPRRPGMTTIPRLWPDSDDLDAIVAEVLATCRGIQGP